MSEPVTGNAQHGSRSCGFSIVGMNCDSCSSLKLDHLSPQHKMSLGGLLPEHVNNYENTWSSVARSRSDGSTILVSSVAFSGSSDGTRVVS